MRYITKIVVNGGRDDPSTWHDPRIPSYPSIVKIIHQIESETLPEAFDNAVHGMIDVCGKIIKKSQKDGYAPKNSYYFLKHNSSWHVLISVTPLSNFDPPSNDPYYLKLPTRWVDESSFYRGLSEYEIGGKENSNDLIRGFLAYAVNRRASMLQKYTYHFTEKYFYQNPLMLEKKEAFLEEAKKLEEEAGQLTTGKLLPGDQVHNFSDREYSAVSYLKKFHSLLPPFEKPKTKLQKLFSLELLR